MNGAEEVVSGEEEKRRALKTAVSQAKKRYENRKCVEVERLAKHPRKWWKMVKQLKVVDKVGD